MTRILVIEDNVAYNKMLKMILEEKGYEVSTAFNGNEGLSLFKENKFDLIVTDIYMPEKEGMETIKEIRSIDPNIKIIAMSGGGKYKEFIYLQFTKDLGADRIFKKPFDNRELLQAISELVP